MSATTCSHPSYEQKNLMVSQTETQRHQKSMSISRPQRVVIIGGGYAGILCANRLAGTLKSRAQITLVNPIESFVERIRLHEVAARTDVESATRRTIQSLLNPSIRFRRGRATSIRADENMINGVDVDSGESWAQPYDKLVYAVGSGVPVVTAPGAAEYAHNISSIEASHTLRSKLDSLTDGASVLVVGGGATAIELVTELAAFRPNLHLGIVTSSTLGPTLSTKGRKYLKHTKAMAGVEVIEHTPVAEVTPSGIRADDGENITADCVVWAASFAVPTLALDSGLDVDRSGRLIVDEFMRTPKHPDILGAGDSILIEGPAGSTLRMACATAAPQGAHAASTITADLDGRTPKPFRLAYLALALSLGPGDGIVQRTRSDDTPHDAILKGKPAAWFNEWNNRYARSILTWERMRAGTYRWAKPPRQHTGPRHDR